MRHSCVTMTAPNRSLRTPASHQHHRRLLLEVVTHKPAPTENEGPGEGDQERNNGVEEFEVAGFRPPVNERRVADDVPADDACDGDDLAHTGLHLPNLSRAVIGSHFPA